MLKIKDNVDLKKLEKFGFSKLENDERGHLYSWKQVKKNWEYEIYLNKDKLIRIRISANDLFNYVVFANKLQTKLYDLIKADLVEKIGSDKE